MELKFVLSALAVWRLTALLVYDKGPRDVLSRLREFSDAKGGPLRCFWCTSVWVSFFASLFFGRQFFLWWWALGGASVLIEEFRGVEEC